MEAEFCFEVCHPMYVHSYYFPLRQWNNVLYLERNGFLYNCNYEEIPFSQGGETLKQAVHGGTNMAVFKAFSSLV